MGEPEKKLCEDYIIGKLQEKGWRFVPADELERESYDEPLLTPAVIRAVERINKDAGAEEEEIGKSLNELRLAGTGVEGARKILSYLKNGIPVKFEKERVVKYVQLFFDYHNVKNNEFVVSRQVYHIGREPIRNDIILYVNGIPLVNIECKSPTSLTEDWQTAYRQIKDYEKTVPELYKYVQIGVAVESIARYFPIVPWQDEVKIHDWREEGLDSIDSTIEMLAPERLLDIVRFFIFYRVEMGESTKAIARYMQYRAANKTVERVLKNLQGIEDKSKGLIWHWQGSGKTFTMIFAANKLFNSPELEAPTIFFIVDRLELEEQLYKEFYSLDIVEPEVIGSVADLKKVLEHDDYRGKRGVFITLIHKFRPEELGELQKELEDVSKTKETVMTRKNVVAFIDEGHRSQYGLLAAQMKAILKGAFFFALTGTPIAKHGRDTYLEFSYHPDEAYLDRYFITDSIRDGFTKKIVYQPRLDEEVHLKKDLLEAFLETEFEELPEEIRGDVESRVKKRLNAIRVVLENPARIKVIAEDMAKHFMENIDGRFKAMVVAGSRKACVAYKREIDGYLPPEYSEVVMTYTEDDDPNIKQYREELVRRFNGKDTSDIRKDIIEKFREEELPKVLIVTDMLLTGFDAPVLQAMYLDKPLKEHRLLQAVARTNRPYKGLKEAGLVLDYVGVLREFKRALEIYSKDDVRDALFGYESVREEFALLVRELLEILEGVPRDYERDSLLGAIEVLTTDERREKEFIDSYRKLRRVFELLGPDEIKLEFFEDYKWLSAVYAYYMKLVAKKPPIEGYAERYYDKTVRFIHRATEMEKLETELPVIEFDEQYLEKLEDKVKNKKEKAANILFALNRLVLVERHGNPVYESLVEKVERLLELWKEKTRDYERIYREGVEVISGIRSLTDRQKALRFEDLEYSLLLSLEERLGRKKELPDMVRELAKRLDEHMFPGWLNQATAEKDVEREVRRFARGLKGRFGLSLEEIDDLYKGLIDRVRNYGAK